jgi:DNA-binding NarL/FixJ family response regulator
MIVETDGRHRAALIDLLAESCVMAVVMSDGAAVIRHLESCVADEGGQPEVAIVIAEVESPGRSGLDILLAARQRGWPVRVVLTARQMTPHLRAEVARMGAAALLPRPETPADWRALLQTVARGSGGA